LSISTIILILTALVGAGLVLYIAARWCGDADCAFTEYDRLLAQYRESAQETARRDAARLADLHSPPPARPAGPSST
jgi:hypothetical protein